MKIDLSARALWPRVKPFFRLWLVAACMWWAYLAWGYWGYRLPSLDPEPVQPAPSDFCKFCALADIPPDYYEPEQVAYREQLEARIARQALREKLFRFSLPVSLPLGLWGAVALLLFGGRWIAAGWGDNARPIGTSHSDDRSD